MSNPAATVIAWTESGLIPDSVIRRGIRRLNRRRLEQVGAANPALASQNLNAFVRAMGQAPVAPLPNLANQQHYEVPAEFFEQVLGTHGKYSCAYWGDTDSTLDQAEAHALTITCQRAGIQDGQHVLDLGCGWGSLSLWMAQRYPNARITAVSNSTPQRVWIEYLARQRGLANLTVLTHDMNTFAPGQTFDRVVSVEMFEHMRNYAELFRRIHLWLKPGGRFFMHIFCHHSCAYEFVDQGPSDWMSRHFFSGGMMPSAELPLRFQQQLHLLDKWHWSGQEYEKTANAWLLNMDSHKQQIMPVMQSTYGADQAAKWFQRWRIFFMACAELFGHEEGREWLIGHYLFQRPQDPTP